jgi:3-oxoacyl-[acyl-carrier-protein] synthase II
LEGRSGVVPLRYADAVKLNVSHGYHIPECGEERQFRASGWLTDCVREALAQSKVDPVRQRLVALVGTGLRELRAVERAALDRVVFPTERLHFASAVREACKYIAEVVTVSNACSAGGHVLALAQDLIELGDADAVIVAAADCMTESMLAMIGRVSAIPACAVRPFERDRMGVLLGEGAAALVITADAPTEGSLARVLATGLSCDARHETAPDSEGISRALQDALSRAARRPSEVDLVLTHGTGTALNDPTEAQVLRNYFLQNGRGPLVTGVKGSLGHTSGAAALINIDVAIRCMQSGTVPPIAGLSTPIEEADGLRLVTHSAVQANIDLVCLNAFGFGGVNAITLLQAAA